MANASKCRFGKPRLFPFNGDETDVLPAAASLNLADKARATPFPCTRATGQADNPIVVLTANSQTLITIFSSARA